MGRKWILPGKVLVPARKKVGGGEQWKVNWSEGDPEIWSYNSSSSLSSEATGDDGLKNGGVCVVIDWHDWLSAARNAVPNAMAMRPADDTLVMILPQRRPGGWFACLCCCRTSVILSVQNASMDGNRKSATGYVPGRSSGKGFVHTRPATSTTQTPSIENSV